MDSPITTTVGADSRGAVRCTDWLGHVTIGRRQYGKPIKGPDFKEPDWKKVMDAMPGPIGDHEPGGDGF